MEMDVDINIIDAVQHAFHVYDGLEAAPDPAVNIDDSDVGSERGTEGSASREESVGDISHGATFPTAEGHPSSNPLLEENATTLLFAGAQLSCLSATLLILNCLQVHGAKNALISELLMLLSKNVLPSINCLPSNEYMASKMLSQLGLAYELIHACPDGCMLFRGVGSEEIMNCTKCQKSQFKRVGRSLVPAKVLQYFPLIPRHRRMYSTLTMAALMVWYLLGRSSDGLIRHIVDSLQWKWVDEQLGDFGMEDRNIRLGLATDGVNPYGVKQSNWSTWPVCLLNYNVPSWLTMKKHFIMLSMIIPGKDSVTCETFDVYIEPLIEELHELWEDGTWIMDASA
jgi:hypothetical protein